VLNEADSSRLAEHLASELADCRQRGIDRLDLRSGKQAPIMAPELQRLAAEYAAAEHLPTPGRIPQIKHLLHRALAAFAHDDQPDAQLISDLFFGDSDANVTRTAGELLDLAQKKHGEESEARFRERRRAAMLGFASFLIQFVADARQAAGNAVTGRGINVWDYDPVSFESADGGSGAETEHQAVATGYVGDGERFIRLLAEAVNVTIVGFTNEKLAAMLETALARKRERAHRPDAFWGSLRIVFLSDSLLDLVSDERSESPDRAETVRQRRQAAVYGRRSVSVFLGRSPASRCDTYESPFLPPLIGTLFEMPDRRRVVQLLVRHSRRNTPDHLYLELGDTAHQYFSAVFEDVIHSSISDNKVVPIGAPREGVFRCTGTRFRQNVLKDGSGAIGWLPMVLVITVRMRSGQGEPMLQLRGEGNATRELNHLSHLSGHIFQDDCLPDNPGLAGSSTEFGLQDEPPARAARRRVLMETGDDTPGELRPLTTRSYLQPDKEHLFCFVFIREFPADLQFPRQAEVHHVRLPVLLAIRENQALRKAVALCQVGTVSRRIRELAGEIAGLNLILHDHPELGQRFMNMPEWDEAEFEAIAGRVTELEAQTRQTVFSAGREVGLTGLSGFQYREFYTMLLPVYADLGVDGATGLLSAVHRDERKQAAIARLAQLYQDEDLMTSMPLEL
jgi:hypothetical protein